jgi:hypothetical protein
MAEIGRFPVEHALQLALQKGQQVGVPVGMAAVAQGVQAIIEGLYADGVMFTVEDRNPLFQVCRQIPGSVSQVRVRGPGGNGNGQRYAQPAPQAPVYYQPQVAPVYQQPAPPPPMYQQPQRAPYQEPIAPTVIVPGQPLPPMAGAPGASGMRPVPGGPVPVNAPVMRSPIANAVPDAPPSMTEAPQPPAPIFE